MKSLMDRNRFVRFGIATLFLNCYAPLSVLNLNLFKNCRKQHKMNLQKLYVRVKKTPESFCVAL